MKISRFKLREAVKSARKSGVSYGQLGGQNAKQIFNKASKYGKTPKGIKAELRAMGVSRYATRKIMGELNQQEAPKVEKKVWEKPQAQGMEKQQQQQQQQQKGGVKTPGWVEKVEKPGEQAPQKTFGQQKVQEDVRFGKLGQMNSPKTQSQPSSNVDPADRDRYPSDVKGQDDYYNKVRQTNDLEKLDEAEDTNAKNIDALLGGGGGGETGGGEEK